MYVLGFLNVNILEEQFLEKRQNFLLHKLLFCKLDGNLIFFQSQLFFKQESLTRSQVHEYIQ